jgi:hypothetical protein
MVGCDEVLANRFGVTFHKQYKLLVFIFPIHYSLFLILDDVFCSLEWWSFELLILLSGLLPNPQLETSVLSIW